MPSRWLRYLDLIRWDRPAGWLLLLWPTLSALWIAADGFPGWHLLAVFVFGTVLMRSAGCCVNDVADRDFDRHVKRTAQRPVTAGTVSVAEALALGAGLALAAFVLVLTTNPPTVLLSVLGLAVTIGYPFAKRMLHSGIRLVQQADLEDAVDHRDQNRQSEGHLGGRHAALIALED